MSRSRAWRSAAPVSRASAPRPCSPSNRSRSPRPSEGIVDLSDRRGHGRGPGGDGPGRRAPRRRCRCSTPRARSSCRATACRRPTDDAIDAYIAARYILAPGRRHRRQRVIHADGHDDAIRDTLPAVPVGTDPDAIVAGDFAGDGKLDLAVANDGSNAVSILMGNGDGTFQPAVDYTVGNDPVAIVAGDFNGDGKLDLAVANWVDGTVSSCWATATARSSPPSIYAVGNESGRDRGRRLQRRRQARPGRRERRDSNDISILMGNGDGTFQPAVDYAVGDDPTRSWRGISTATADLDLAVAIIRRASAAADPVRRGRAHGQRRRDVPARRSI